MIELRTRSYKRKAALRDDIRAGFEYPVIFYLIHNDDACRYLVTFVILDFAQQELTYIVSYLPENIAKLNAHPDGKYFRTPLDGTMHCALQVRPGKEFLAFFDHTPFFYRVDHEKNVLTVYTGRDLPGGSGIGAEDFGATFFKDDDDGSYFNFSACGREGGRNNLYLYRASLDLSECHRVATLSPYQGVTAPHVTRKYANLYLNSLFAEGKYVVQSTGECFDSEGLMRYVYENLYKEYCARNGRGCSMEEFYRTNTVKNMMIRLEPGFDRFCRTWGENFIEQTQNAERYRFTALPGEIFTVNAETRAVDHYRTAFCAPGHFEVDPVRGDVYVSCHNIAYFNFVDYIGPAAIEKFRVHDGKLIRQGIFSDPSGYRFTTHRLFTYGGRLYFCTFGHPNRLFFVEADSMKLCYYCDIEKDVLSGRSDVRRFLNAYNDPDAFTAFEVSGNNGIVFILGRQDLYFFSFPEKRIIQKIPYLSPASPGEEIALDQFCRRTSHSNFLQ